MSPTTEIIDPSVVKTEVVEYLGSAIEDARTLAASITDDVSLEQATTLGALIKQKIAWLKERRKAVYEPLKTATENVRLEYDTPLKLGEALEKTLVAAVITYKQKKRDEETRARLALEAEAKRQKEEAARKEREAQAERERVVREREAREQKERDERLAEEKRKADAVLAEKRAAEEKAQKEADARAKQLQEEEDRRLATAQEAHNVGLAERSEQVLDKQMPVAPLPAPLPTVSELAAKAAQEKADQRAAAEEAKRKEQAKLDEEKKREDEAALLKKLDEEAARAKAEAAESEAAASQKMTVSRPDERMRTSVSWKWDVANADDFRKLCLAIGQNRAPVEYGGFDPEQPQKFRAAAITKDVTRLKDQFAGADIGIRAWPEESGSFKAVA